MLVKCVAQTVPTLKTTHMMSVTSALPGDIDFWFGIGTISQYCTVSLCEFERLREIAQELEELE